MKKYICFIVFLFISVLHSQINEKEYFFVFLNSNPDREELSEEKAKELQQGHMNNINKLEEEGKLITAGPVKGGGGIFVLYASSLEEADEYLQLDPAIKANRFKLEVYPMKITEGELCRVPEEDFTMVNYSLIRYKDKISINGKSIMLVQIEFPERNEGVAVLNYDLEKGNNEELNSYFVSNEIIYIKTLWIAKGSFCEQ